MQTWPLAYWPDGSLKWSGFATVAGAGAAGPFRIAPGDPAALAGGSAVAVREGAAGIDIDTGRLQCRIPHSGASIIDSLTVEGRVVARQGRLRCTLEDRTEPDAVRLQHFVSAVRKTTVEQTGPVRAVVRIEGSAQSGTGQPRMAAVYRAALLLRRRDRRADDPHHRLRRRPGEGLHSRLWALPSPSPCANRCTTGTSASRAKARGYGPSHSGRFAGLGSRHNVRHWGCGAKEARISQAAFRRFYYYLTTDERTGDIMREVVDVDYKVTEIDPMRLASPRTGPIPYPGRIRGGPDWLACAGNWMTEWERTGETKYRDKILAGMDSIAKCHTAS